MRCSTARGASAHVLQNPALADSGLWQGLPPVCCDQQRASSVSLKSVVLGNCFSLGAASWLREQLAIQW